jgi:hypothetical protein
MKPKLSAYAQVFGQYSYNHKPIAPPVTHVLIHEKPNNRDTWAPHAIDAWYIGPALKHYRCYRTYVWETRSERTTDTLTWMPKNVVLPQLSPTETIIQCTQQLTDTMQKLYYQHPSEPFTQDDDHIQALTTFQNIFQSIPSIPKHSTTSEGAYTDKRGPTR